MAVPTVHSPGDQGQGRYTPVQPQRTPTPKDATGSVLRTSEKELAFTLKIPNSEANLGKVHKTFIDAVFWATDSEVTLLSSNNRTTPDDIREPKDFPKNESDHKAFFRRHSN